MDPLLHMGVVLRCVNAYTSDSSLRKEAKPKQKNKKGRKKKQSTGNGHRSLRAYADKELNQRQPDSLEGSKSVVALVNLNPTEQSKKVETPKPAKRALKKSALEQTKANESHQGGKRDKEGHKIRFGIPDDLMDELAGYDMEGISTQTVLNTTFSHEGATVSVAQYYDLQYQLKLQHMDRLWKLYRSHPVAARIRWLAHGAIACWPALELAAFARYVEEPWMGKPLREWSVFDVNHERSGRPPLRTPHSQGRGTQCAEAQLRTFLHRMHSAQAARVQQIHRLWAGGKVG